MFGSVEVSSLVCLLRDFFSGFSLESSGSISGCCSRASATAPACKTLPVCAGLRRPFGVIANLVMNTLVACSVLSLTVNFAAYDECIAVNRNRLMHARWAIHLCA